MNIKRMWYWFTLKLDKWHCLLGAPAGLLFWIHGDLGQCWFFGFLLYEIWQSHRKGDNGYPEIKGFLFGTMVAGLIAGLIILILEVT